MSSHSSRWMFLALLTFMASSETRAGESLPWGQGPVSASQGTFLMMSDLHFDPFADSKLVPALIQHPVEDWEGILNSSQSPAFAPYGKDSNWPLLLSALREAQSLSPYDYAVFTGDYLVHESRKLFEPFGGKDEKAYEDFVLKTEVFTAQEVQKNLPGLPVYFCLGNNDSECGDYMIATRSDFLSQLSRNWGVLADHPEAAESFSQMGNYALPHPTVPGMELVVLNDVYWSSRFSADSCHLESGDQGKAAMDWLKGRLKDAKAKNLKVQLVMHIPPAADAFGTFTKIGKGDSRAVAAQLFWATDDEEKFLDLVKAYPGVLVSGFAGHTHMDDFRVLSEGEGNAPFFIHICPAVSPIRGNNPGFQIALYDRGTGAIQDMATYDLTNLPDAKSAALARWQLEYAFDKDYGLKGYDGNALLALADQIQKSDSARQKFSLYYRGSMRNPEEGKFIPDDAWKTLNLLHTQWTLEGLAAALGAPAGK
ncbi:MAG TPA: metallophosphoesterase [bacterium]|jgi:sphingomyelin phosphodiesterase acid-like 3|nr:metallophosphoesterase [bacterium]